MNQRVVLVTGAADGIGWATAQRFAAGGDHVVIADLRAAVAIERAAALGPDHLGLGCDVSAEASVVAAVQASVARFGRIDVLVNNAGIGDQACATVDQQVAAFDRVLGVHLRGTFLMSREVGRQMLSHGCGAIVNLASIVASAGIPGRNAYGAAKAGIVGMTRAMAVEWGLSGVRVNAVAPGYVRTALVDALEHRGALDSTAIHARTPMGRMGTPAEIAEAIAFLASPAASYITGTVLQVDGGWTAHGSLYMLGAYIGYSVALHSNFWVALFVAPAIMAVLGVALDRWGFRLLQDRDPLTVVLVTFGLLLIIEDGVQSFWGKSNLSVATPAALAFPVDLFGTSVPAYRLGVIVMGLAVALGLTLWLRWSKAGLFVRAASTDPVTTAMQGVNTDALSALVVGLGTALAGLAGVVAAPFLSLSPSMSSDVIIDSFVVVVVGGLGSLAGAFIAAMVLGMVQALGAVWLPDTSVLLPFLLMVVILIWKPAGFAGSRT